MQGSSRSPEAAHMCCPCLPFQAHQELSVLTIALPGDGVTPGDQQFIDTPSVLGVEVGKLAPVYVRPAWPGFDTHLITCELNQPPGSAISTSLADLGGIDAVKPHALSAGDKRVTIDDASDRDHGAVSACQGAIKLVIGAPKQGQYPQRRKGDGDPYDKLCGEP